MSGGRDDAHRVRENARFCGVWKSLYERWENGSRQRYNTAALNFDRIATRYVIQAENESLQSRDYAVRQLKKMLFPKMQGGANLQELTVKGINIAIRNLYEHHLSSGGRTRGTVAYLRERAEWFQSERNEMDEMLGQEANDIQRECESALRALLELLAQEEWQAYLDHLKDRLAWDIQPQTEEEFPCEGSIGYLSVSTDVNELGSGKGKFDLKWKPKLYENKDYNTKVSGSVGVSIGVGGQANEFPSISGKAETGPFRGKAKVTLTNKVNPWNNQEYTGIKLKGSAGFGLSAGKKVKLGVACYPSSGSVTLYPRALYEDAVKYLSTPSTPPSGGRH